MPRGKIISRFFPARYITAHHGGSGEMAWGYAEAYRDGREDNCVIVDQADREPHEATAKAVAILRAKEAWRV
jgi:hypothetical protein